MRLGGSYNLWYDYFTLPLIATVIFLLIERLPIRSTRLQHLLASLSACAFGMYLLHEPIQMLLRDVLPTNWPRPVGFGVVLAASFLLSYAVVALDRLKKDRPVTMRLTLPDGTAKILERTYFTAFMNLPYEGGGFKFTPEADPGDGMLDVISAHGIGIPKVLFLLPFRWR